MARAYFYTYALDEEGRPIAGPTCTLYEPGTTTKIGVSIYAADTGATTKANPFTADSDGRIEFFLDVPKQVDILIEKTGYDPKTITAIAHQLTAATLTLLDDGVSKPQRSGVNFQDGFVLTDDSVGDETEIDLDYAGTAQIADIGTVEDAGASTKVARGDHVHNHPVIASGDLHSEYVQESAHTKAAHDALALDHDSLSGVSANDHHAQAHAIDGADHTGTLTDGQIPSTIARDTEVTAAQSAAEATAAAALASHAGVENAHGMEHADLNAVAANDHHNEQHQPDKHTAVVLQCHLTSNTATSSGVTKTITGSDMTADIDTDSLKGTTEIFTVPAGLAGKWKVSGQIAWESDGSGRRKATIQVNDADSHHSTNIPGGTTGGENMVHALPAKVHDLVAGDDIRLQVDQNTGAINLIASHTWLAFEYLGA